ncbi:MAG: lipid A biosynthesis acyltransferase [Bacteroidetes bacterium]|nr:lipid A biosynthesis acyltransferase [Bacteroidota bacterium]
MVFRLTYKLLVYPILKGISLLPFPVLYRLSNFLYLVLYHLVGYRKKVVRVNLQNSFPDKTDAWRRDVERKFYRHLTDMFLETFKGMSLSKEELLKRMTNNPQEIYDKAFAEGRSSIIVMSHKGNWEWVSMSAQLHAKQKAQCIYKQLKNPFFEKLTQGIRSKYGTILIPMEQTLRVLAGQSGMVTATAFIGDQNPSNGKNAYWTKFLNQDTAFMWGTEKIARKTNQEVWYLQVRKIKRGYYEAHTRLLCSNPAETKEGEITELLVRATEEDIMSQPENWLWSHRRWKYKKPD